MCNFEYFYEAKSYDLVRKNIQKCTLKSFFWLNNTYNKNEGFMEEKIIFIYCLCYDYLKYINHVERDSYKITDAEILTIVLVASVFFYGNHETARLFLKEHGYIMNMLSIVN